MIKEIHHIGIVGQGKMGTSIFYYLNDFEFRLSWLCSSEETKTKAEKRYGKKLRFLLQSGALNGEDHSMKLQNTTITSDPADLKDCDLIIEAITEDLNLKRQLFGLLDSIINTKCVFTSNSSSILPSLLLPAEKRKDKFAGLHFFFPVGMKSTVEFITGPFISDHTHETLTRFLVSINKKVFAENEENAFLLNKIFLDFQAGAYNILLEGKLSMKEIDDLVKQKFFPSGVFGFFDHVGIDVMMASVKAYTRGSGNDKFYSPLIGYLEKLVSSNHLGIKTRKGFYDYGPAKINQETPENKVIPDSDYLIDVEERLRNYYLASVERALNSGIISSGQLSEFLKDYLGTDEGPPGI